MKKILLFVPMLCLALCLGNASAQNNAAWPIVERYNQVTGLDRLSPEAFLSVMMDVEMDMMGQTMNMKIITSSPDKIRAEIDMDGQTVLMVVNGAEGWFLMPGQDAVSMPEDVIAQFSSQIKLNSNYQWSQDAYDFEWVGEESRGAKLLQVVKAIPKVASEEVENMKIYFDKETGLAASVSMDVVRGSEAVSGRVELSDYKILDGVKTPTLFSISVAGEGVTMKVKDVKYNFPVKDEMFLEPR